MGKLVVEFFSPLLIDSNMGSNEVCKNSPLLSTVVDLSFNTWIGLAGELIRGVDDLLSDQ